MGVTVRRLRATDTAAAQSCEGGFVVASRLVAAPRADGGFDHHAVAVAPYEKRYQPLGAEDLATYLDGEGRIGFVAEGNGRVVGRLLLSRAWNGYARLDDLAVASMARRQGAGTALVARALAWAREQSLAGAMLETQDVNVPACRLYERCGFVLGGIDRYLYRGLDPATDEVALYWYRIFA